MMYAAFLLVLFSSCLHGKPMDDPVWREYKLKFGKFYATEEEATRYQVWKQNVKDILAHNDKHLSYQKGVNNFTDMTHEEFRSKMGGCYKIPKKHLEGNITSAGGSTWLAPHNVKVPESVDWRKHGYVTPVKNQGQCGSCYAFSTTGSLEGQWFRKTKRLPEISEQNILDCSKSYGNQGCNGGWMDYAFAYIRDNQGVDSEYGYPYYARELGYCYYKKAGSIASGRVVTGWADLSSPGNETNLKLAVGSVGPISVAIDASHPSLMHYSGGIYYEINCGNSPRALDHAVLVVGYGSDGLGKDYWLIKNSWSTHWGEGGYVKLARNRGNHCGVATKPSFPLV